MSTGDKIVQRDLVPLPLGRPGGRAVTEERAMQQPDNKNAITRDKYDAVLLDLDGVITDTATIHATVLYLYPAGNSDRPPIRYNPPFTTCVRGLCHDSQPRFLPARADRSGVGVFMPDLSVS